MAATAEKIKQRRLDRMRQGQAVCDFVHLPSDTEIRLAIVPLTEAEYLQALEAVAGLEIADNLAGLSVRDRRQSQEILIRAIREADELTDRVYDSVDEMMEAMSVGDVDHLIDRYNEMVHTSSPSIEALPKEEFENLKLLLQEMDWNALSGPAWWAAKRFLGTISHELLRVRSPGSTSTNLSITTNE